MIIQLCTASVLMATAGWLLPVFIVLAVLAALYIAAINIVPGVVEKGQNKVIQPPPYRVPEEVETLHKKLLIADLHADPLMWRRDLLKRNKIGQVDVPRMLDGNYAFQVFGVVTKSPKGQNFESNSGKEADNITLLAILSGWPLPTWSSLMQRALYQAKKLQRFAERSGGTLMLVHNQADLAKFLERRQKGEKVIGGFVDMEGVHALEGKLENVDLAYKAGFRMIGLTHFFDNEAGGSAHGLEKGGLTDFGRAVVKRTQELHMLLDMAHSSPRIIDEVLEMTTAPLVASHTGVRGTCDNVRNLSDEHVRGIARTGGVIGIAMFDQAVGENSLKATARAMRYTADLVGVDHVALGGDCDGTISAPIDYSGIALLTQELLAIGFSAEEIDKIMGWNFMRVLKAVLPG